MDALSDGQRRKLLVDLLDHNPQEISPETSAGSDAGVSAVEPLVQMHHVHLPKLADYGFINWSRTSDEFEKGPNFDEIRPLLELLEDHPDALPNEWL